MTDTAAPVLAEDLVAIWGAQRCCRKRLKFGR
jgi:hypothetical protein